MYLFTGLKKKKKKKKKFKKAASRARSDDTTGLKRSEILELDFIPERKSLSPTSSRNVKG